MASIKFPGLASFFDHASEMMRRCGTIILKQCRERLSWQTLPPIIVAVEGGAAFGNDGAIEQKAGLFSIYI